MIFSLTEHDPGDAAAADWILPRLGVFGTVGGLVPMGYAKCVLIDHTPADSSPGLYTAGDGLLDALSRPLADATSTPEKAWFAIWEGYGVDEIQQHLRGLPRLDLPGRGYHVLTAPVTDAGRLHFPGYEHSWAPDLWWPDDRQWFVATDTDLGWSYLAGDDETVAAVEALMPHRTKLVTRDQWNSEFSSPTNGGHRVRDPRG